METNIFVKRLIFTLTTGSLLFYLVSFHSVGQTKKQDYEIRECRIELLKIRSGKPVALRFQEEVTSDNVLQVSPAEQRMITRYIKASGQSLKKEGLDNPFLLTTYRMESPAHKLLGYKVVVDTIHEEKDVMTFYLTKKNRLLFWYLDSESPQQDWSCQI